jgi:hypothetical protein
MAKCFTCGSAVTIVEIPNTSEDEGTLHYRPVTEDIKGWIASQQARANISPEYNLALGRVASEIKKLEN